MIVFEVTGRDLDTLLTLAQSAKDRGMYLRVGTDDHDGLKIADGQGMWTLPIAYSQEPKFSVMTD